MVCFITDMHSYKYIAGRIVYNVKKYYSGKLNLNMIQTIGHFGDN